MLLNKNINAEFSHNYNITGLSFPFFFSFFSKKKCLLFNTTTSNQTKTKKKKKLANEILFPNTTSGYYFCELTFIIDYYY
jgi:hypothetical protein